MLSCS